MTEAELTDDTKIPNERDLRKAPFLLAGDGVVFRRDEDGEYTMWVGTHWDTLFGNLWTFEQVAEYGKPVPCENPEVSVDD